MNFLSHLSSFAAAQSVGVGSVYLGTHKGHAKTRTHADNLPPATCHLPASCLPSEHQSSEGSHTRPRLIDLLNSWIPPLSIKQTTVEPLQTYRGRTAEAIPVRKIGFLLLSVSVPDASHSPADKNIVRRSRSRLGQRIEEFIIISYRPILSTYHRQTNCLHQRFLLEKPSALDFYGKLAARAICSRASCEKNIPKIPSSRHAAEHRFWRLRQRANMCSGNGAYPRSWALICRGSALG